MLREPVIALASIALLFSVLLPSTALGQVEAEATENAVPAQETGDSIGALPGIIRVAVATPLARGAAISAFAGYGFTGSVLEMEDSHHRAAGQLAVTLRLTDWVGFGVRFDGRYDKHNFMGGDDDGYVGDPRIIARVSRSVTPMVSLGAHVDVWLPGAEAPSLIASATTVEALAVASATLSNGLVLSANAGFRLDNSSEAVDDVSVLSLSDRLALGLSDSNALVGGLGLSYRAGQAELLAEATYDYLIGESAPPPSRSPLLAGGGIRYALADSLQLQAYVRGRLTSDPIVRDTSPLVAVTPRFSAMAGLHYQFGGPKAPTKLVVKDDTDDKDDTPPPSLDPAQIKGKVVSGGAPISDAAVTLTIAGQTQEAKTAADGGYAFDDAGKDAVQAEVKVETDGFKPSITQVTIEAGKVISHDIELERILPPGQIRGVVRDFRGQPVIAEITIQPIGKKLKPDTEGVFSVDVAPGEYEVVVEHPNYRAQRKQVKVEKSLVTILNIDMQKP